MLKVSNISGYLFSATEVEKNMLIFHQIRFFSSQTYRYTDI